MSTGPFWSNPTSSKAYLQAALILPYSPQLQEPCFVLFLSVFSSFKYDYFQIVHQLLSLNRKNIFKERNFKDGLKTLTGT